MCRWANKRWLFHCLVRHWQEKKRSSLPQWQMLLMGTVRKPTVESCWPETDFSYLCISGTATTTQWQLQLTLCVTGPSCSCTSDQLPVEPTSDPLPEELSIDMTIQWKWASFVVSMTQDLSGGTEETDTQQHAAVIYDGTLEDTAQILDVSAVTDLLSGICTDYKVTSKYCQKWHCWQEDVSWCFEPSQPHRVISGLARGC